MPSTPFVTSAALRPVPSRNPRHIGSNSPPLPIYSLSLFADLLVYFKSPHENGLAHNTLDWCGRTWPQMRLCSSWNLDYFARSASLRILLKAMESTAAPDWVLLQTLQVRESSRTPYRSKPDDLRGFSPSTSGL